MTLRTTTHGLRRWPGFILLAGLLSGCGWGYSERMKKPKVPPPRAHYQPQYQAPPQVPASPMPAPATVGQPHFAHATPQMVPGARDLYTLGQNHTASQAAVSAQDMGLHAFALRLVDQNHDATRLIHCVSGKVISHKRHPSSAAVVNKAAGEGVPPGVWVLRVDPKGRRADLPNNDWYRHISRHHQLEFLDRSRVDGTVLYRYVGPRKTYGQLP